MTQAIRSNPISISLSVLLLASFLLAACGGGPGEIVSISGGQASVEVQAQQVQQAEVQESVAEAVDSAESQDSETDVDVSGDSSVEIGLEKEEQARVAPELDLGNPQLKASPAGVFDRFGEGVKVLEFFAFWCPNCKALASRIHGLEAAYDGEVEFTFLDIDDPANRALMDEYGFYYQPYVLVIDEDGTVHQVWVGGGIDVREIQAEIERLIAAKG